MLFEDQRDSIGFAEGEVFTVNAAFSVNKSTVGELAAVRQKDGKVRAHIIYYSGDKRTTPLVQEFSPAEFEKFYYELGNKIAALGYNVVEFNYRTRTIDNPHTAMLMEEEQTLLTGFFLKGLIEGHDRTHMYEAANKQSRLLATQMQ